MALRTCRYRDKSRPMSKSLSPDAEVTLLLTAPLTIAGRGRGREDPPRLLTFAEYGKLARRLLDCGRQLGDLLGPRGGEILEDCQAGLESTRVHQLLRRGFQLSQALEHWAARAIWVVSQSDAAYPARIKQRLGGAAPPVIFGCGDRNLLECGGLAVVGSRHVSDGLIEYAERIGRIAATADSSIVSGGARGVDQAAMRGALNRGGAAIGVLADGLERSVMQRENRAVLMDNRLTLISPYDPQAGFSVGNAMRRNKLVYALADAGLVVDATHNKGGTWAGAVEQLDKLRLVPIYVRTDGESSKGLEALLQKGARSWPNPQAPEDFRVAVLNSRTEAEALWKSTLLAVPTDMAKSANDIAKPTLPSSTVEKVDAQGLPPAEALFERVEELLGSIDTPTTESDVAAFLQVSTSQAREWLKRLVLEGKYKRSTRPVRYDRVPQAESSLWKP